ncbi:MAG: UDP-N-acetylmuramoyl-L-alanyl-D-glutamate--2,6-diaminopimelate ligase [Lachnospiraceae bacterium]
MQLKEWLDELEYRVIQGNTEQEANEVVFDSRKAAPGSIFVCMHGTKVDSHDFVSDVVAAGAKILVTEKRVEVPEDVTVIQVVNGRAALARLSAARFGYPAKRMLMIGITGTKGKTTTTHMLKAIMEQAGKKTGMIGTNGVTIGTEHYPTVNTTPESYDLHRYFAQMADAGCECCVMEVSSQAFKMHRVDGIMYDYALFTNISNDHIGPDEHKNFEEYIDCKKEIFNQCRYALINQDDEHFDEIIRNIGCDWSGYSLQEEARFQAEHISYISASDFVGLEFDITGAYQLPLRVSLPGKFNVYNALAAAAVALSEKVPADRICQALEQLRIDGRMEIVYTCDKFCVIVDYAHNAVSMESLLETLSEYNPARLVCIFGSGGNRSKDRRYAMGEIAGKLADFSVITADNSRFEKVEDIMADIRGSIEKTGGTFIEIPDRREAIKYSIFHAEPGDMIAVIGKGHEDYQEIEGVRYPFLDRSVVEETVAKWKEQGN